MHFACAKKSVVVLLALHVNTIKLGKSGILVNDLTVSEEAPDLTECHGETFFSFNGLHLARVVVVPGLKVTVVAKQYVLALLFNINRVGFKFNKI
jgi:hypothetical protein